MVGKMDSEETFWQIRGFFVKPKMCAVLSEFSLGLMSFCGGGLVVLPGNRC